MCPSFLLIKTLEQESSFNICRAWLAAEQVKGLRIKTVYKSYTKGGWTRGADTARTLETANIKIS